MKTVIAIVTVVILACLATANSRAPEQTPVTTESVHVNGGLEDFIMWQTSKLTVKKGDRVKFAIKISNGPNMTTFAPVTTLAPRGVTVTEDSQRASLASVQVKMDTKNGIGSTAGSITPASFIATSDCGLVYSGSAHANVILTISIYRDDNLAHPSDADKPATVSTTVARETPSVPTNAAFAATNSTPATQTGPPIRIKGTITQVVSNGIYVVGVVEIVDGNGMGTGMGENNVRAFVEKYDKQNTAVDNDQVTITAYPSGRWQYKDHTDVQRTIKKYTAVPPLHIDWPK